MRSGGGAFVDPSPTMRDGAMLIPVTFPHLNRSTAVRRKSSGYRHLLPFGVCLKLGFTSSIELNKQLAVGARVARENLIPDGCG